ncbi:uncharacterized protein LOC128336545 [Hemicordylus capensis]|uniref:uncharacterized protein LOC128336545 n=1 Tax=Hemicordylus capensis TaxID=884348 RepID=UPI002303E245|nr:uncharacterized protein LOC128336545 [Hemicordylus capensis]
MRGRSLSLAQGHRTWGRCIATFCLCRYFLTFLKKEQDKRGQDQLIRSCLMNKGQSPPSYAQPHHREIQQEQASCLKCWEESCEVLGNSNSSLLLLFSEKMFQDQNPFTLKCAAQGPSTSIAQNWMKNQHKGLIGLWIQLASNDAGYPPHRFAQSSGEVPCHSPKDFCAFPFVLIGGCLNHHCIRSTLWKRLRRGEEMLRTLPLPPTC